MTIREHLLKTTISLAETRFQQIADEHLRLWASTEDARSKTFVEWLAEIQANVISEIAPLWMTRDSLVELFEHCRGRLDDHLRGLAKVAKSRTRRLEIQHLESPHISLASLLASDGDPAFALTLERGKNTIESAQELLSRLNLDAPTPSLSSQTTERTHAIEDVREDLPNARGHYAEWKECRPLLPEVTDSQAAEVPSNACMSPTPAENQEHAVTPTAGESFNRPVPGIVTTARDPASDLENPPRSDVLRSSFEPASKSISDSPREVQDVITGGMDRNQIQEILRTIQDDFTRLTEGMDDSVALDANRSLQSALETSLNDVDSNSLTNVVEQLQEAVREVEPFSNQTVDAPTSLTIDPKPVSIDSSANARNVARPRRTPDIQSSRARLALVETLARELALVKQETRKYCSVEGLKGKYPDFNLWTVIEHSQLRELVNGEAFVPKAYAENLVLAKFGLTSRETLKKDRRKLRKAKANATP